MSPYSVQSRNQIFLKDYGFLSVVKNWAQISVKNK